VVEILERLVYLVNSGGTEFGITVMVRGRVITGMLTPNERFHTWMSRTLQQAAAAKDRMSVAVVDESRMSENEIEGIRRAWRYRQQDALDSPSSDAVQNLRHSQDNFCLRNARLWGSFRGISEMVRVAYLMLDLDSVEAFTLGELSQEAPKQQNNEE